MDGNSYRHYSCCMQWIKNGSFFYRYYIAKDWGGFNLANENNKFNLNDHEIQWRSFATLVSLDK